MGGLVSVIVPAYNAELYIGNALESIIQQTYTKKEIILVNDGSTDLTGSICRKYSEKYDYIKYFEKDNSGVSDTRNFGIEQSQGDYIIFLDADDLLTENALEVYVQFMSKNNYDVVYAAHCYEYEKRRVERLQRLPQGEYDYLQLRDKLLDDGTISGMLFGSVCGVCYKAKIIKDYNVRFKKMVTVNEDGLFNLQFINESSAKIYVLDLCLYIYRQWKENKKYDIGRDVRFDNSESEIIEYICSLTDYDFYKEQLACRCVSITFWNAIRVRYFREKYLKCRKYLYDLFNEEQVREGIKYVNYNYMNIYKKILCKLIENKNIFLFYVIIKYLYPVAGKFIKR